MDILIRVTVDRQTGKFRSRDEIGEAIVSEMPSSVEVDDSEYEVTESVVEEEPKRIRAPKKAATVARDGHSDRAVLVKIQALLDRQEWSADTADAIAAILRAHGLPVREIRVNVEV